MSDDSWINISSHVFCMQTRRTDCLPSICPLLCILQGAAGGVQAAQVEARGGGISSYAD